jgi:Skp family chaperone for outer membrane proteins
MVSLKDGKLQLHLDNNFNYETGGIVKLKRESIAFLSILLLLPMLAFGQNKIGYIASERVRAEFEEFQEAEAQLQLDFRKVQEEYQVMLVGLDSLKQAYEAQRLMSSPDWRTSKENEIASKEQQLQQFQAQKVGPEGELYRKQAQMEYELLSKVKTAVDNVAISKGYDFIFDGSVSLLYGKPTHDLTDDVLFELRKTK